MAWRSPLESSGLKEGALRAFWAKQASPCLPGGQAEGEQSQDSAQTEPAWLMRVQQGPLRWDLINVKMALRHCPQFHPKPSTCLQ